MDSWPLFVIADYLGSVAHVSSRRHPRKMPSKENKRGGPFLIYTTQIIFCTTKYDAETKRPPQVGHNAVRSEEHTSELQSPCNLVCRLLLEKKKDKLKLI